jgi:c-di-GMP-binding flagellar brake protein YcgR
MSFAQREHYRVPINVPVTIELGGDAVLEATCHDISMGGMGLLLQNEIAPRSQGLVKMRYEQPDPSRKRVGIQFTEVDEDNKCTLARILVNRLQELEGTSTDAH